jgi:hypothetical protein
MISTPSYPAFDASTAALTKSSIVASISSFVIGRGVRGLIGERIVETPKILLCLA